MSTTKFLSMAVLLTVTAFRLPAAESAIEREAQDRKQIEKLMWQYARALDSENPEAYAAVYTPDGQFGAGPTPVKGRDALKKMIQDLRDRAEADEKKTGKKRPAMFHTTENSYLEFTDKDHAHMEAYWMTVFAGAGQGASANVAAVGREVDEFVRVDGHWLIKSRDVAPQRLTSRGGLLYPSPCYEPITESRFFDASFHF